MASADDDTGIPPMPALPPIGGIADLLSGDEFPGILLGQNSPPGAAAGVEDTPPIRRINVHSDEPSAMSGMKVETQSRMPGCAGCIYVRH